MGFLFIEMAYGKFQRRRRYYKYRNSALSTRRIFSKTNSKNQAVQIYKLNRKVNAINRANKPETRVVVSTPFSNTYSSSALSSIYYTWIPAYPGHGVSEGDFAGSFVRSKSLTCYYNLEYYNSSTTGYHNSESAGCTVRLVVFQLKSQTTTTNQSNISITDLFRDASNTGAGYTNLANCPFRTGVTDRLYILSDRKVVLTSTNNTKNIKVKCYPKNLSFNVSSSSLHNQVFAMVIATGLHYDTDYTEYVEVTASSKFVYTDA